MKFESNWPCGYKKNIFKYIVDSLIWAAFAERLYVNIDLRY